MHPNAPARARDAVIIDTKHQHPSRQQPQHVPRQPIPREKPTAPEPARHSATAPTDNGYPWLHDARFPLPRRFEPSPCCRHETPLLNKAAYCRCLTRPATYHNNRPRKSDELTRKGQAEPRARAHVATTRTAHPRRTAKKQSARTSHFDQMATQCKFLNLRFATTYYILGSEKEATTV
jgi:hypothetical protein